MYSPFLDTKGKPKEINKVKYEHIKQLKEIDEGIILSIKSCLRMEEKHN